MAPRRLSVLALALLAACEPIHPHPTRPVEASPPELAAGAYVVTVTGVAALLCDGVPPRVFLGEQAEGELRVGEDEVRFTLDGFELRGDMVPGALFVEGAVSYEVDHAVESVDRDAGAPPEDGDGPGGAERPDGSDCGGGESRPRGEERGGAVSYFSAIDAQILDESNAEGRMTLLADGCAVELEVTLVAGAPSDDVWAEEEEGGPDTDGH